MYRIAAIAAVLALAACSERALEPVSAEAAFAGAPPEIAAKTRALGQTMDPSVGFSPYDGAFTPKFWSGMTIHRAIAYGEDRAQLLDIYVPDKTVGTSRPVLLFVHGGGFRGGSRSGMPYPDNVLGWAAHEGMVGVSVDYRLAPEHPWPAAARDLSRAIGWLRQNAAEYGGDPDRIVLFGHSAGANHVADYVARPEVRGAEAAGVMGAILLSPFYAADPGGGEPHVYYGNDLALQSAAEVVGDLRESRIPLFIGIAEFDPDNMRNFGQYARDRLCEHAARCPGFADLADHNHFTEGIALGTGDESLAGPLLAWMRQIGVL